MRQGRKRWISLVTVGFVLIAAAILYVILFRPAWALNFYYRDTTIVDFNAGILDHVALSWRDDGEIQLLPIGLGQPWAPGNNIGLPPRSGHAAVYHGGYIYVIGGESRVGSAEGDVFYTTVYTSVYTVTERLDNWTITTPLPIDVYTDGVVFPDAVALNGYVYVIGGKETEGEENTYYKDVVLAPILSDGTLGAWQETASLPIALFALEVQALHGRIYILGGLNTGGVSSNIIYFAEPSPSTGEITGWTETTALPVPNPGAGGYWGSAATVEHGRIYLYGGASGVSGPSVSPFIYFSEPNSATGEIAEWILNPETLGRNLFAAEGAAYESGLLLTIAGADNNLVNPTGDVLASLVDHPSGMTGEWLATIGLSPERFWHAAVRDEEGWLYCIGGSSGTGFDPLNDVEIAPSYGGGGGGGGLQALAAEGLHHTEAASLTYYAPDGVFYSSVRDLRIASIPAKLQSLSWNTTITDPAVMTVTLDYHYKIEGEPWSEWFGPFVSDPGNKTTSTLAISGTCDFFQYRTFLTTTVMTQTPLLNAVSVGVLAPPDLEAVDLTLTGCDDCPGLVRPDEPVQIEFTVRNRSTGLAWDDNFLAMAFITTTPDYYPEPPDCPPGCDCTDIDSCPLIWGLQGHWFEEGESMVLTATWTFAVSGTYYLVAYIDYDDTPAHSAPIYNIKEFNEENNFLIFTVQVGVTKLYLPLVFKNGP